MPPIIRRMRQGREFTADEIPPPCARCGHELRDHDGHDGFENYWLCELCRCGGFEFVSDDYEDDCE